MAKRKKYPKLPNGFGSIKYLGKGRRNPYGVYPPVKEYTENGVPITPKALCYVNDWMKGFAVLNAYHAGTYQPGMDLGLETSTGGADKLAQQILADFSRTKGTGYVPLKTFAEVFEDFWNYKFEKDKSKVYSQSSKINTQQAFKNCKPIHNMPFTSIRLADMQNMLDNFDLKRNTIIPILSLLHQMYKYAIAYELVDKDYSAALKINQENDAEHGAPFTHSDLEFLWKNKTDEVAEFLLIMCYSGYRISAFKTLEVNLEEGYFRGGVKTAAGKGRIVPIHSAIRPLVEDRLKRHGSLVGTFSRTFNAQMGRYLKKCNLPNHTPHDCRHTFSMLCEEYGVNENDRKRLIGHSFGNDITNAVYGHRSVDALRNEIEKIKVCY